MGLNKSALAAAIVLALGLAAPAAMAQTSDSVVTGLTGQIEVALRTLSTSANGAPTHAQIQQTIATVLSLSKATAAQKEAALMVVEADAKVAGSGLPPGTADDVQLAYEAIENSGATAANGAASGGFNFGSAGGSGGGGGGGSSYTPG